jgi:hypothetical protein
VPVPGAQRPGTAPGTVGVFTAIAWARMIRAVPGHEVIPITKMITPSDGPRVLASTIASGRNGTTRNQSVTRISRLSVTLPKWPATMPTDPITMHSSVAVKPISSEIRAPQISSVSTDRPSASVPSG